jgi:hypothetical protein
LVIRLLSACPLIPSRFSCSSVSSWYMYPAIPRTMVTADRNIPVITLACTTLTAFMLAACMSTFLIYNRHTIICTE